MITCYIQHLEKHKDGWHIRFSGSTNDFWGMLSNFKREQKLSGQVYCYFDPKFFGKGGWFCNEAIFVKYAENFSNYADMRQKAIQEYQQSGRAEEDRRKKEAKEAARKAAQEAWQQSHQEWQRQKNERQKQRNEDWERTQQRHREEQTQQQRRTTSKFTTALTIPDALEELGLAPLTPLSTLTEKQVKAAFRVKALKAHPDTGGSNQAFIRLNQAYQLVLIQVQRVGAR